MKIFTEVDDFLGKKVYRDKRLEKLKERFNPKKISFVSLELTNQNINYCDCIVTSQDKIIDLIIQDLDKAEFLLNKLPHDNILKKVIDSLGKEEPLSSHLSKEELDAIKEYAFLTSKPIVILKDSSLDSIIENIIKITSHISFFTVNKNEARAWLIEDGTNIVEAASKIHTDLARGFIRAEIYNISQLDNFKNPEEAKSKGILKIVNRDYIVQEGDVVNIKFKV